MSDSIGVQLAPRIQKHCLQLWRDEHYKHAAREAMIQVELALKEKGMVIDIRHGKTLIDSVFTPGSKHRSIKLRVPLGDDLQDKAKNYFNGVFGYYRNYLAHDGSQVDKNTALRILVIASELLDLIDASALSFSDLGGVDGLLEAGIFYSEEQLLGVLKDCNNFPLQGYDASGLLENILMDYGAHEYHLDAVIELDLVRWIDMVFEDPYYGHVEKGALLELTDLGKKFIDEIEKRKS